MSQLDDDLLTVREVVDLLKLSERTIRAWIADRRLPAVQLGGPNGPVRVSRAAVADLLRPAGNASASEAGHAD